MLNIRYSWRALGGDISGGAVAALIALPYGLAMASLMGLPPVLGIFTSILTGPITAVLGRNPVLIGGTASATVPFIKLAVAKGGIGGGAKVSLVAAVFMMAFCVMRLGRYVRLVPHTVLAGFSCGIGAMMAISQYDALVGNGDLSAGIIGGLVIVAATLSTRFAPRLPAPLVGVIVAVAAAAIFPLQTKQVGSLPLQMPDFTGFAWMPGDVYNVLPSAFGLALVASVNILITSRVVDHFRGRHKPMRPSDADAELGAYGIANACAGIFGAPMSAGIPARSLASVRCGATSRLSNVAHALFLIAFLEFGSGFISRIPLAALAGITAWMGFCLLDWSTWRRLPKMRRIDAAAFLSTAIAVLTVNAVYAVAIGCSFYIVHYLWSRFTVPQQEEAASTAG